MLNWNNEFVEAEIQKELFCFSFKKLSAKQKQGLEIMMS